MIQPDGQLKVDIDTRIRGPIGNPSASAVVGDAVVLKSCASVLDVYSNNLRLSTGAVILGSTNTPLALPLLVLPPLPPEVSARARRRRPRFPYRRARPRCSLLGATGR